MFVADLFHCTKYIEEGLDKIKKLVKNID
ncbi:MAG: hypothetical protein IKE70_00180 [Bacilli bacterium]|nr:hypothetical protein [Bacilli bacterium]